MLDRLLEKIKRDECLTDAELNFAKEFLWEIMTADDAEGISQGDKALAGDMLSHITVKNRHREAGL